MSRYFCHNCNIRLDRINEDFTCPTCSGGFVEELDESQHDHHHHHGPHGMPPLPPFNPFDFLQLIGLVPPGPNQQQQHHHPQHQSRSQPSSPGLSGGTPPPTTLAGAATASAAATANSQFQRSSSSSSRPRRGGPYHGPHFSFVIDGRQVAGGQLGAGPGQGGGGGVGGATGGEAPVENMLFSFLSDLITGLGGGIPITGNINLGDYAWGREGLDAIVTQLMNNMEGTGPPPMAEEKLAALVHVHITAEQVESKLQCSVCWEDFSLSEKVIRLECEHLFHPDCILPWLKLHATCPVCRKDLNGAEGEGEGGEKAEASNNSSSSSNNDPTATTDSMNNATTGPATASARPFMLEDDMEFD